ncbi:oligosaccharide flippase family protein, partial [Jannaschia sp. AI_61]|uniref:oligosaccharide flippase family protein n=1 Tax=Jannaschia sp. AI_61 TaxID=2829796 RepID=UPI001C7D716B
MVKSALLLLSGNAATSLMLLARNLLVARLIPVADYGIAATFAIAMAVVEMASQLGLQQQIVQAKNGEDPRFQAALQGFQVLRGAIGASALFLLAPMVAEFLRVPDVAWAYQVVALVPLLMAFTHFDIHRLNRAMRFWPTVLSAAVPALAALLVVWPLSVVYGDWRVMLWSIVVRAALIATVSHVVAERPYRLVLDRAVMGQALRFGWPLLVNGMLLFAVFQGDKLIVGRELGMEPLALFAMGVTLTLTPTLVTAKSTQNFFLPQLSKVDRETPEGRARFDHLAAVTLQISLVSGLLLVAALFVLGPPLVAALLGDKYQALVAFLVPLAVAQALRVAKAGAGVVAMAGGETRNAMQANLVRVAALPLAWWAVVQGADLRAVIVIGILGEMLGYGLSLWLVRRRPGVSLPPLRGTVAVVGLFLAVGALSGPPLCPA